MEQWYANKLDKLGEIEKFLGRHKTLKLTQDKIENLNRLITSKKIDSIIKTFLPQGNAQDHMSSEVKHSKMN